MGVHAEIDTAQTLTTTTEASVVSAQSFESYGGSGATYSGGEPTQPVPAVITAVINVTPGAASTGVTVRCRHGVNNLTGALVGVAATLPAAGGEIEFLDTTGDLNGYTITAQQVAATGNGTVNAVAMDINPQ